MPHLRSRRGKWAKKRAAIFRLRLAGRVAERGKLLLAAVDWFVIHWYLLEFVIVSHPSSPESRKNILRRKWRTRQPAPGTGSSLRSPVFQRLLRDCIFGSSKEWYGPRARARFAIVGLSFMAAVGGLASPFFQKIFVDRLMSQNTFSGHGSNEVFEWFEAVHPLFLILMAFFATLLTQLLNQYASFVAVCEGVHIQDELTEEIYEKTLSTRTDEMGATTVGEAVAIYATDIPGSSSLVDQVIPMAVSIAFPMIFAPIAIHWICGIPITATVSVMAVMIFINFLLANRQSRFFYLFKKLGADRTGIVNEWVQNIRLLRILGWIENYEAKIFKKREEETANRVAMVTNGQLMNSFASTITYVLNLTGVAALMYIAR